MSDFERNLEALMNGLSLEQITALAEAAKKRQSEMEQTLIRDAENKFIEAYKAFRTLAPNHTKYICWEYENCNEHWEEQDFNLYEMLDAAINERLF